MIFKFAQFEVDIDVDKTCDFYRKDQPDNYMCSCSGCRNFREAISAFPQEVTSFFAQLGIDDMRKAREVYINCANADNTVYYSGWYHLCGKLISGEWVPTTKNGLSEEMIKHITYSITDDFRVSFHSKGLLLEAGFPLPVISLEIYADVPWVLDEENTYPKDMNRRK